MGHGIKKKKNGAKKEKQDYSAPFPREDDASYDLFAKLLIKRMFGFLEQSPSDFAITILPPVTMLPGTATEEERVRQTGGNTVPSSSLESLSSEHRSLIESSIVLVHESRDTGKSIGHLGLEARSVPMMARILRKSYRRAKKNQNKPFPTAADKAELFRIISCLLLIQPDHATAWADRRRYLLSRQSHDVQLPTPSAFDFSSDNGDEEDDEEDEKDLLCFLWSQELDYLDVLVTQHSKAPSYWAHRKFVLRQILQRVDASYQKYGDLERANRTKDIFFSREVKTCIDVAEKYPKNYYAWTHRRYLWDLFSFVTRDSEQRTIRQHHQRRRYIQLMETELMIGMWQEWLPKHPGDHSSVHYSCQVLDLLLHEIISLRIVSEDQLLEEQIGTVCFSAIEQAGILLSRFSENESLWILRRITYKILWKHLFSPSIAEKGSDQSFFSNKMSSLAYLLVRNDLKSILSSTLSFGFEHEKDDNNNCSENACDGVQNPTCVHAWTFLAWCIANLEGIDDNRKATKNNLYGPNSGVIFTPKVRETALSYLTSITGTLQHNHLVYSSSSSPFPKSLAAGATNV